MAFDSFQEAYQYLEARVLQLERELYALKQHLRAI